MVSGQDLAPWLLAAVVVMAVGLLVVVYRAFGVYERTSTKAQQWREQAEREANSARQWRQVYESIAEVRSGPSHPARERFDPPPAPRQTTQRLGGIEPNLTRTSTSAPEPPTAVDTTVTQEIARVRDAGGPIAGRRGRVGREAVVTDG